MVGVSRIAKEYGSKSILLENKFTNVVLYNLIRVKKYSTCGIVSSVQQTVIPAFLFSKCSTVHGQFSVNIAQFHNTVSLKKPRSFYLDFTNLNSLSIVKNILIIIPQPYSLYKLSISHCTIPRRPRTAFWKANVCIFLYISVRKCLFHRCEKLFSSILIEIFGDATIFQHFNTSTNSIDALKFSRQFGLQV